MNFFSVNIFVVKKNAKSKANNKANRLKVFFFYIELFCKCYIIQEKTTLFCIRRKKMKVQVPLPVLLNYLLYKELHIFYITNKAQIKQINFFYKEK